jgi:hypothetical protein
VESWASESALRCGEDIFSSSIGYPTPRFSLNTIQPPEITVGAGKNVSLVWYDISPDLHLKRRLREVCPFLKYNWILFSFFDVSVTNLKIVTVFQKRRPLQIRLIFYHFIFKTALIITVHTLFK